MKKMAILTMAVILLVASTVSAQPVVVVFNDVNLEGAVRDALGIPVGDITSDDMLGLISFSSVYNEIADLTGLEYATNLTVLELYWNDITDLTPLSGLTNLTFLNLQHNQISDITQLSGLTNVNSLDLADNQVVDIGPLSGFSSLTHLRLSANQITSVGPLSGSTSLTELHIAGNQISNIGPLSSLVTLQFLDLVDNQISDISPLSGLTNLMHLELEDNQISDISPLSGLTNLATLDLERNQISDLSALSGLTNLWELDLDDNQASDLSPLSGLTNLTELELPGNQISDISPLSGLTKLDELYLHRNQLSDISPLSGLTNLGQLHIDENQLSDISPLSGLTNLWELDLEYNQISDISPLSGLTNLADLDLHDNQISDITPLDHMTNLLCLWLYHNPLNCDAYRSVIPSIITNNPGIDILYDPEPPGCSGIDWLALTTFKDYHDGTPLPNPWGVDIWVYASNPGSLNYIEVTKPGDSAPFTTMYESGDSGFWDFSAPDEYASLPDLRVDYPLGIYTFDFYDSGSILIDSVSLNYSITEWPDMPVDFTNPSVNGQIISANPTLTWTVDPGAGDALMRVLEDVITEETFYADAPVSMTSTSWAPGLLIAGRQHELDVSVLEIQDWVGPDWPSTTTTGGDSFSYSLMTEYFNEINFLTMPATGDLSGLIWMLGGGTGIGYSLEEGNLLYFYSSDPVLEYNITTGQWVDDDPEGWIYIDWPFYYVLDPGYLIFALPPESGLWVYHFGTGQWEILPRIIP